MLKQTWLVLSESNIQHASLNVRTFENLKKKFNGNCRYCSLKGHMWRDYRKRKKILTGVPIVWPNKI